MPLLEDLIERQPKDPARLNVTVGKFAFSPDYANPSVNIDGKRRTDEHDLMGSDYNDTADFNLQTNGREPRTITVSGVVRDIETDTVDKIGREGPVYVRADAWTGTAAVKKSSTSYRREKDKKGYWLHDVTFELIEIAENKIVGNPTGVDLE